MQIKINRTMVLAGMLLLHFRPVSAAETLTYSSFKHGLYQEMVPLTDALKKIQQTYHVSFNYSNAIIANKYVAASDVPVSGTFSETKVSMILHPLGLTIVKITSADYAIRPMENLGPNVPTNVNAYTYMMNQVLNGTISNEKGESIPGAVVTNKATGKSVMTDGDGHFSIDVADANTVLTIRSIGYTTREVKAGNSSILNVQLLPDVKDLSAVVVTALGIKREEKALGYSIATLDGSKVNTVKEVNVVNALSGKVAGVDIRSVSSDPGASVMITIRGASSLVGNQQPLFVVNGVPVASANRAPVSPVGSVTVDYGSPISDINPDDIASITVLKGASAAALYGSRAGNGVILITTKSGSNSAGKGLNVNANFSAMYDKAYLFPKFQNEFGAGDATGSVDPANTLSGASWGPRLDQGAKYVQWNSPTDANGDLVPTDWVSYPNRVKDFYQTGSTYTSNVAISGENFRLSYTNLSNKGITPNTDLERNTLNLAANHALNSKVKISTNIIYTNNRSDNRPTFNRGSSSAIVYTIPANINTKLLKNYWIKGQEGLQQFSQDLGSTDNPYFVANENLNGYNRNRLTGNLQLNIDITKDLSLMARTGLDYYNETDESRVAFSTVKNLNGGYAIASLFGMEQNSDFLLTYKKTVNRDWNFSVSGGGNRMDGHANNNSESATSLIMPNLYNIANATAGTVSNTSARSKRRTNSLYGMGEVSYKNYAFLSLTARNDWSSTLPKFNDSYFYPSASLSVILTDMLKVKSNVLSFAKVRVNWSKVGKDASPYSLLNSYTFLSPNWGNVKEGSFSFTLNNNYLKPEMATSTEFGTDLKFFGGRLGLEATYYNTSNRNQIIPIPTTMASGYSSRYINAGEINNKGWEIGLTGTPVNRALIWSIGANFTRNRNKIVKLTDDITSYLSGTAEGVQYQYRTGQKMGDFYGRTWTTVPDGPFKGKELLDNTGHSQYTPDFVKVGNYNSDFMVGFTNTFTWRHFTLNTLIDWRQGGQFFSYMYMNLLSDGRTVNTLKGRDAAHGGLAWNDGTTDRTDGMIEDGYVDDGNGGYVKNTNITDPESFYGDYYWKMHARNTFSATYIKLREVSLTYLFSKTQIGRLPISNLSLSLIARNLVSWTAAGQGYDPETSMSISSGSITPGTSSWSLPYTRSYGVKLGLNF